MSRLSRSEEDYRLIRTVKISAWTLAGEAVAWAYALLYRRNSLLDNLGMNDVEVPFFCQWFGKCGVNVITTLYSNVVRTQPSRSGARRGAIRYYC